jgi:hypothetical protein
MAARRVAFDPRQPEGEMGRAWNAALAAAAVGLFWPAHAAGQEAGGTASARLSIRLEVMAPAATALELPAYAILPAADMVMEAGSQATALRVPHRPGVVTTVRLAGEGFPAGAEPTGAWQVCATAPAATDHCAGADTELRLHAGPAFGAAAMPAVIRLRTAEDEAPAASGPPAGRLVVTVSAAAVAY